MVISAGRIDELRRGFVAVVPTRRNSAHEPSLNYSDKLALADIERLTNVEVGV